MSAKTKHKEAVLKAAIAWWKNHRPLVYSAKQHLANPGINTCNPPERKLALAVGRLLAPPHE